MSKPSVALALAALIATPAVAEVRVVAEGQGHPISIVVNDTHVFWGNWNDGTIRSAPLTGAEPPQTVAEGQPTPYGLAVDATHLYWVTFEEKGTVARIPLTGGPIEVIATEQKRPMSLGLTATEVFWVNEGVFMGQEGSLMRYPKAGGIAVAVATNMPEPRFMVSDGEAVYWSGIDGLHVYRPTDAAPSLLDPARAQAVAVGGGFLYWTEGGPSRVFRIPVTGGEPQTVAQLEGTDGHDGIGVLGDSIYWTRMGTPANTRELLRTNLADGVTAPVYSEPGLFFMQLATGGGKVAWIFAGSDTAGFNDGRILVLDP
jgi:hypothetical protein